MQRFRTLLAVGLLLGAQESRADDGKTRGKSHAVAEERLKSIYEKRDFAPATFPGKWLADSSG